MNVYAVDVVRGVAQAEAVTQNEKLRPLESFSQQDEGEFDEQTLNCFGKV